MLSRAHGGGWAGHHEEDKDQIVIVVLTQPRHDESLYTRQKEKGGRPNNHKQIMTFSPTGR